MFDKRYYYLLKIQYLGFRFHGWQKQPDVLTVERMMERTLAYVLGRKNFKYIAAGRTDAKVSVNCTYVELFLNDEPLDLETFETEFNKNLPQDIRMLNIVEVDDKLNLIQHPKIKEYIYSFSYGEKNHPFCAPFMVHMFDDLDIELMQKAAKCFEGFHDLRNFCYKASPETQTEMEIISCELVKNDLFTANFFPKESYLLKVQGAGFKRHQIRLMMGALFELGKGELSWEDFNKALDGKTPFKLTHIAQASGLMLNDMRLEGFD